MEASERNRPRRLSTERELAAAEIVGQIVEHGGEVSLSEAQLGATLLCYGALPPEGGVCSLVPLLRARGVDVRMRVAGGRRELRLRPGLA